MPFRPAQKKPTEWFGALLIPILGLVEAGGWDGLQKRIAANLGSGSYTHLWSTLGNFTDNPMGIHWTGIVLGLGWVISFGYWTTDFLVVQRVLAAKDLRSAKLAPIIGAGFKMMVPFIVILPGLLGLAVLPMKLTGEGAADDDGQDQHATCHPQRQEERIHELRGAEELLEPAQADADRREGNVRRGVQREHQHDSDRRQQEDQQQAVQREIGGAADIEGRLIARHASPCSPDSRDRM